MKSPAASEARNQSEDTFCRDRWLNGNLPPNPHPRRRVPETKISAIFPEGLGHGWAISIAAIPGASIHREAPATRRRAGRGSGPDFDPNRKLRGLRNRQHQDAEILVRFLSFERWRGSGDAPGASGAESADPDLLARFPQRCDGSADRDFGIGQPRQTTSPVGAVITSSMRVAPRVLSKLAERITWVADPR